MTIVRDAVRVPTAFLVGAAIVALVFVAAAFAGRAMAGSPEIPAVPAPLSIAP